MCVLQVRELAASTLGGLVQCCYIQAVDKLKVYTAWHIQRYTSDNSVQ